MNTSNKGQYADRVMDWHDQIFIPHHLRHALGMDRAAFEQGTGRKFPGGLLILRDPSIKPQ